MDAPLWVKLLVYPYIAACAVLALALLVALSIVYLLLIAIVKLLGFKYI